MLMAADWVAAAEITFWHSFTQPARIAAMEETAAKFQEETGHTVHLEVVPWPNVEEKWTTAAAAGTLPDASICLPSVCLDMNEAGVSRSMDGVAERLGGTDAFASQGLLDSFNTVDGQLISLPFYGHARLLIYRKDIFAEAGLEAADDVGGADRGGGGGDPGAGALRLRPDARCRRHRHPPSISFSRCRRTAGPSWARDGNASFNTPDNVAAVRTLLKLYEVGSPEGELSLAYHRDLFDLFTTGRVGDGARHRVPSSASPRTRHPSSSTTSVSSLRRPERRRPGASAMSGSR